MTARRRNRLRAAVARRIRRRLGITEIATRADRLERRLEELTERVETTERQENRPLQELTKRLKETERQVNRRLEHLTKRSESLTKRGENLGKRSDIALRRLAAAERELEVWRFMAWLERARPASERLISVITPTRNRADVLERCIGSVLAQAHAAFELVVVDDGSDDATPDVLARYTDSRVRSFRTEHVGVSAARNHGLERATGSVVAYLDDDNIMDPLWLMAVARAYDQRPEIPMLYGVRLDDWQKMTGLPVLRFERFDRARLETQNLADTNVIAHRRDHPEARFDENITGVEDWDLMLRLTSDGPPYELPAIACAYSTRGTDRLSDRQIDALRAENARVIAKHGLSVDQTP